MPERSGRPAAGAGSRERLSREALVSSALALADAEGLKAVTIRRLAADHGVTPMALYWHFRDKTLLIDAVAERVLADIDVPQYPTGGQPDWDVRLVDLFSAMVATLRDHRAVAPLVHRRLMTCTPGLALGESCFAALEDGGFSRDELSFIGAHAMTSVIALVTMPPFKQEPPVTDQSRGREDEGFLRSQALAMDRFPHVTSSAAVLSSAPEAERIWYATGINVLVAGITSLQAQRHQTA